MTRKQVISRMIRLLKVPLSKVRQALRCVRDLYERSLNSCAGDANFAAVIAMHPGACAACPFSDSFSVVQPGRGGAEQDLWELVSAMRKQRDVPVAAAKMVTNVPAPVARSQKVTATVPETIHEDVLCEFEDCDITLSRCRRKAAAVSRRRCGSARSVVEFA